MAEWVLIEDNTITEYHDLLPTNWKNISGLNLSSNDLPFLKSLGWYKVTKDDGAESISGQVIRHEYTIREDDVLETPVIGEIIPQAESQIILVNQLEELRKERNKRLSECDWTQLADVQSLMDDETKNRWLVYRQALRDMPENMPCPWPEF